MYLITIIDKYGITSKIYVETYKHQQFWIQRLRETNPNAISIEGKQVGR